MEGWSSNGIQFPRIAKGRLLKERLNRDEIKERWVWGTLDLTLIGRRSGHFQDNLFDKRDEGLVMTTMSETKSVTYVCCTFTCVRLLDDDFERDDIPKF